MLGYAFYCWLYAAAGSTAERQDQVQTLALPLSLPILIAYIYSITVASSGNPSFLFKVLAYFPPTAPFAMPVLVGLDQVAWWQFLISVALVHRRHGAHGVVRRRASTGGRCSARVSGSACVTCGAGRRSRPSPPTTDPARPRP